MVLCARLTKAGTRCKRQAKDGPYCAQHKDCQQSVASVVRQSSSFEELFREALKMGWSASGRGEFHPPHDWPEDSWTSQWRPAMYEGKRYLIPHWFERSVRERLAQVARESLPPGKASRAQKPSSAVMKFSKGVGERKRRYTVIHASGRPLSAQDTASVQNLELSADRAEGFLSLLDLLYGSSAEYIVILDSLGRRVDPVSDRRPAMAGQALKLMKKKNWTEKTLKDAVAKLDSAVVVRRGKDILGVAKQPNMAQVQGMADAAALQHVDQKDLDYFRSNQRVSLHEPLLSIE